MTAYLIAAGITTPLLTIATILAVRRLRQANRTLDEILADFERLHQDRPARLAPGCRQLGQCAGWLRGDEPADGAP